MEIILGTTWHIYSFGKPASCDNATMNKEHRPSGQIGKRVGGARVCALYLLLHC